MDYKSAAEQILSGIGGKDNIVSAAHCATRLRLVIADNSKCSREAVEAVDGVKGVFEASGQIQIIFGTGTVNKVYEEFIALAGIAGGTKEDVKQAAASRQNPFLRAVKTLGDIFVPIIPAIVASGLLMGILEGLVKIWPEMAGSGTYTIIHLFSNAAFVFLPILIAVSAAKVFGGNIFLGAVIGMIMIHTELVNAWSVAGMSPAEIPAASVWFGLYDIRLVGYQGHVVPIVIAVWLMSKLEKWLHKVVPEIIDLFVTPLVTVLVTGYLTLTIIGPVFSWLENSVLVGVQWLITLPVGIGAFIVGALYAPTVVAGVHHMYNAIEASMISANNINTWMPIATAANVAQGAAALAFAIRTSSKKTKAMAFPASLSAFLGITEPAIFGVNIRYMRPFIAGMIGGACGAVVGTLLNVQATAYGVTGVFGLLITTGCTVQYLILMGVSFGVAFLCSWFLYKGEKEADDGKIKRDDTASVVCEGETGVALSPMNGTAIPLSEVKDPTFSQEILGKGIAVIPSEGRVCSPVNGEIISVMDTGHAIGILAEDGAEYLIHVGMDTVRLGGKHFEVKTAEGEKVHAGQLLIAFDMNAIMQEGYELTTPVVVTNSCDYTGVEVLKTGEVAAGEKILRIRK